MIFHRHDYAQELAQEIIHPGIFGTHIRSGLFLPGIRRIGKTTFIRSDLIPALEELGAVVIYADLWSDTSASVENIVHSAIRAKFQDLQTPGSKAIELLERVSKVDVGAGGFQFGFELDKVGISQGVSLPDAFEEMVRKTKSNVILVVDEVQRAIAGEDVHNLMHSLKATRDHINLTPDLGGFFQFIGTGSHKSLIADMATRRAQAFYGALVQPFKPLGMDYIQWLYAKSNRVKLPTKESAYQGFVAVGNRPEELMMAFNIFRTKNSASDQDFISICDGIAAMAASHEIFALEELGELALAIFEKIALGSEAGVSGLFGTEACDEYEKKVGIKVEPQTVQKILNKMIVENFVHRVKQGYYTVADPMVRQTWLNRKVQDFPEN